MRADVRIETERLILRPTQAEDFKGWAEMMADPETARFIGGVQPAAQAWRGMMTMAGAWHLTGVAMFSVIEKATGRWVGRLGPWTPLGWPGTEVGWGLHRAAWGKGYATEGAAAAMDYAFDVLGWNEVIHCIDPENTPSARVAERLGSRMIGPVTMPPPFEHMPVNAWGQSREEWAKNRLSVTRPPAGRP
ncbi:GNAT family N-acetyltransferase [Brevundimonas sp. 2R-24]|uniref:GNAT family N-acetyltransferase n=2 Tax=Peiella sedimenti TaxID=3061083 RepID=A0ABT8SH73_9CAUL|nr:GNAT family N-acetyltransferase [Caulobacteraceae bacterium XZ-24]